MHHIQCESGQLCIIASLCINYVNGCLYLFISKHKTLQRMTDDLLSRLFILYHYFCFSVLIVFDASLVTWLHSIDVKKSFFFFLILLFVTFSLSFMYVYILDMMCWGTKEQIIMAMTIVVLIIVYIDLFITFFRTV